MSGASPGDISPAASHHREGFLSKEGQLAGRPVCLDGGDTLCDLGIVCCIEGLGPVELSLGVGGLIFIGRWEEVFSLELVEIGFDSISNDKVRGVASRDSIREFSTIATIGVL